MSGQTINISLGKRSRPPFECIALVLQGGEALFGAYQAGVCEALAEPGLHPDWVAGISIGAINALGWSSANVRFGSKADIGGRCD
jgi:NTE family protein